MLLRDAKRTLRAEFGVRAGAAVDFEDASELAMVMPLGVFQEVRMAMWLVLSRGKGGASVFADPQIGLWSDRSLLGPDFKIEPPELFEDGFPPQFRPSVIYARRRISHLFARLQPSGEFGIDVVDEGEQIIRWTTSDLSAWVDRWVSRARTVAGSPPTAEEVDRLIRAYVRSRAALGWVREH